jgi:hypothetical protein
MRVLSALLRALLVVALVAGGAAVLSAVPAGSLSLLGPDCEVRVGDSDIELSAAEGRSLTTLAAVAQRDGHGPEQLAGAARAARDAGVEHDATTAAAALVEPGASPAAVDVALAEVLLGAGPERLSCRAGSSSVAAQDAGPTGLTPRAQAVVDEVEAVLGPQSLGGFAPGGVSSGHIERSAHYEGRAVDVFYRPVTEESLRRGWVTAQWMSAHAERLEVATVIFDRRLWSSGGSGWRDYRHPSGVVGNQTLDHVDHVHVDMLRGR